MKLKSSWACGLCGHTGHTLIHTHQQRPLTGRQFMQCNHCQLIQVPPTQRYSSTDEKALYDLHQNAPDDMGYRNFLTQVSTPLHALLVAAGKTSAQGLDFGAGPGPVLPSLLQSLGHRCEVYDLYYAPNPERLQHSYDFICATEVFEHLAQPQHVMQQLHACLNPNGLLAVMMQRPDEQTNFSTWGYLNDPTHISFYTESALNWLSNHWQLREVFRSKNVIIWQKQ